MERAAIKAATVHYRKAGWNVISVERENRGYDLLCKKGRATLHVEVKGASGLGRGFILTAGEMSTAKKDAFFEHCLVRSAIHSAQVSTMSAGEMLEAYRFDPLALRATWQT